MLLNLTDRSDEPLQGQIVREFRARILSGQLTAGDDLPSIRLLARQNRVSVITVQRAYETLEHAGLIHSRRGKGFFVSELTPRDRKAMALDRLRRVLKPAVEIALAEGLFAGDVESVFQESFMEHSR